MIVTFAEARRLPDIGAAFPSLNYWNVPYHDDQQPVNIHFAAGKMGLLTGRAAIWHLPIFIGTF